MHDTLDAALSSAVLAARHFYNSPTENNEATLNNELSTLILITSKIDPTARLSVKNVNFNELLNFSTTLLGRKTTSAVTRSRLILFLFNLVFYNVPIRKYLAGESIQLCGYIFDVLKISLLNQLGPQNLIDILRLIQVLTYERSLSLGVWANDLISFLLTEIIGDEEPEWMPYCTAILCNLASRSKSVCQRIRNSSSYKAFSQKILKLLAHDSRMVVVSSLILVGYLEERLRDTVFRSRNIPQTFQCVFNVLILGDCLMTRHIAADLLKRLVVSDIPTVSSTPQITAMGKDLTSYSFFQHSIEMLAGLFVKMDPKSEESLKIYDIFLSFCSLPQLVSPTALAVLKIPATEQRFTTPIRSICSTSQMSFIDAIVPEVPLKAIRLLRYLLQECIESGDHIQNYVPHEIILTLVEDCLKTAVETNSQYVAFQCDRINEGLRLVGVIASDDEMRSDILDVVSAPLCSHLVESQMISNPVVAFMSRPVVQRIEPLAEWSANGVTTVLELLKVLADLKDYSKLHKDQYWKLLKDERLVPFVAYAVAYGDHRMICDALLLYTHCAQVHAFPTKWLSDLIASCVSFKSNELLTRSCDSQSLQLKSDFAKDDRIFNGSERRTPDSLSSANIEEVGSKITDDMVKDPNISQIVSLYERKINLLKIREKELENLLARKDESLKQSERLRLVGNIDVNDNEVCFLVIKTLRQVIIDHEKKVIDSRALIMTLRSEKKELEQLYKTLKDSFDAKTTETEVLADELAKVNQEKAVLLEENESEREFSMLTKARYDELKTKFDQTSSTLIEKDLECIKLSNDIATFKSDLSEKNAEIEDLSEKLQSAQVKCDDLEKLYETRIKNLQNELLDHSQQVEKLKKELEKVSKFKDQMLRMMNEI
ncbi:unnamed protein product [Dracunculus medinensis]|uniref:Serine/threonine-protein kinase TOR n=1 Tax=Dracunculus medinensis TaxID=318479 RepID=A0A158Q6C1_DRAME|nr:unnamed protein product [Dracunculus medinensis]